MKQFLFLFFVCMVLAAPVFSGGVEESEQDSGPFVVYTYDAFPEALSDSVASHFEESFGVEVSFERFADTGGLFNQLFLEREEPRADAMIGLDNTYLGRIFENDLLEAYRPADFQVVSEDLIVDPEFRAVPFDFGRITLNYDSEQLSDPPASWEDLLDPRFEDSIILMNPRTSSPGRNFLLFTIAEFGEGGYLDFWRELSPNVLTITDGWSEGYGLYTQGEAPIVLSYDTSPAFHIYYEDETRYRNIIFGNEAYAQIEVAGIVSGTEQRENAERFMDFIVSPDFQELIPLNQIIYPIHPAVQLPEAFRQIETAERNVRLEQDRVEANIDQWLDDWEATIR